MTRYQIKNFIVALLVLSSISVIVIRWAEADDAPLAVQCPLGDGTAFLESCDTKGTVVVCTYVHQPETVSEHRFQTFQISWRKRLTAFLVRFAEPNKLFKTL